MHRFEFDNGTYEVSDSSVCSLLPIYLLLSAYQAFIFVIKLLYLRETGILPKMIAPREEWSWSASSHWKSSRLS